MTASISVTPRNPTTFGKKIVIPEIPDTNPTIGPQAAPYKSEWKRTTAVPLTRENFLDLVYGKTPTIRSEGFLTPEQSFAYEKELSHKLAPYKHNTGPLLQKVGVAQFEYQAQTADDFLNRTNGESLSKTTKDILSSPFLEL